MPNPPVNPLFDIPENENFKIPVYFSDDTAVSYIQQITKRFQSIVSFLQRFEEEDFEPYLKLDIIERIKTIQKLIIEIIGTYLNGYPALAYCLFERLVEKHGLKDEITALQQVSIPADFKFYRLQIHHGQLTARQSERSGFINQKKPLELFHPPFQRRRSVATNRFSISGYPCLYLSESIHTSYSECFSGSLTPKPFHVVCFRNIRPLFFIDLSEKKLKKDNKSFPGILNTSKDDISSLVDNLNVYQLIIATHTKIDREALYDGEKYYFKAEYIIPQLFLQWLKHHGFSIDGIRYKSCTGDRFFPERGAHYNYVLPVKRSLNKGFCPSLSSIFTSSPVFSWMSKASSPNISNVLSDISNDLNKSKYILLKKF